MHLKCDSLCNIMLSKSMLLSESHISIKYSTEMTSRRNKSRKEILISVEEFQSLINYILQKLSLKRF